MTENLFWHLNIVLKDPLRNLVELNDYIEWIIDVSLWVFHLNMILSNNSVIVKSLSRTLL